MKLSSSLYFGDMAQVLRPHRVPDNSVGLIYMDPPYCRSNAHGLCQADEAQTQAHVDLWTPHSPAHNRSLQYLQTNGSDEVQHYLRWISRQGHTSLSTYLTVMLKTLLDLHRVLMPGRALVYQCDSTWMADIQVLLEVAFGGHDQRMDTLVWQRTTNVHPQSVTPDRMLDFIHVFHKKGAERFWRNPRLPVGDLKIAGEDERGPYTLGDLTGKEHHPEFTFAGITQRWSTTEAALRELEAEGRLAYTKKGVPKRKNYVSGERTKPVPQLLSHIPPISRTERIVLGGFQKPVDLVSLFIGACTEELDIVLDPCGGTGTTAVAAAKTNRRFISLDVNTDYPDKVEARIQHDLSPSEFAQIDFIKDGVPTSMEGVQRLLSYDKGTNLFERWVVSDMLGAEWTGALTGYTPGPGDGGRDGKLFFNDLDGKQRPIWIAATSQKSGWTPRIHALEVKLRAALRDGDPVKPHIAVLVILGPLTKGEKGEVERINIEFPFRLSPRYESSNTPIKRLQIITVEELLAGARINTPTPTTPYHEDLPPDVVLMPPDSDAKKKMFADESSLYFILGQDELSRSSEEPSE